MICYHVGMGKDKPLTQAALRETLKDIGVATKKDVREVVGEEIERREVVTNKAVQQVVEGEIKKQRFAIKEDMVISERRLIRGIGQMEKRLQRSNANLAETSVTRKEFDELSDQVANYQPLN